MRAMELVRYSRRLMGKSRASAVAICILPLLAELFFRFAEAAIYSLLLYFGQMQPIALFRVESGIQLAVMLMCTVLRWITVYPLTYAAAVRMCAVFSDERKRAAPYSKIVMCGRGFWRSIAAAVCSKLIGMAALVPAVFFGVATYRLVNGSLDTNGVFMAVHAAVLTLVSLGIWAACRVSLSAVPYLLAKMPQKNAFAVAFYSLRFMRGRRRVILRLGLIFLPLALTIIGIPTAVCRFKAAYALGIDIFIREDEYAAEEENRVERNKTGRGLAAADDAEKFSHRKKRRLKENAGEA